MDEALKMLKDAVDFFHSRGMLVKAEIRRGDGGFVASVAYSPNGPPDFCIYGRGVDKKTAIANLNDTAQILTGLMGRKRDGN